MKSKRKVLLAITIPKQSIMRGIVRYAREHDWHLVTDMLYTGRVPLGWRGDGILTILGYRKELVDFVLKAGIPTVAITQINERWRSPASRVTTCGSGNWRPGIFWSAVIGTSLGRRF